VSFDTNLQEQREDNESACSSRRWSAKSERVPAWTILGEGKGGEKEEAVGRDLRAREIELKRREDELDPNTHLPKQPISSIFLLAWSTGAH